MEDTKNKISFKNELFRKSIHLFSAIVPVIYIFIERTPAIYILSFVSAVLILLDLLRIKYPPVSKLYLKFLKPVLRGHEIENKKSLFTGGTYITISFLICVIIFPKPLAITSMFVVIFCDSFAALIGKSKGRHYISNKTLEGSLAFLITGILIIMISPKITETVTEYYTGLAAVLLTTLFELLPLKIDDNISIPVFFGCIYLVLLKIFL